MVQNWVRPIKNGVLAQPRNCSIDRHKKTQQNATHVEKPPKPPPPRITAPKTTATGANQMSPSTHNILKKLKEVTKKSDNQVSRILPYTGYHAKVHYLIYNSTIFKFRPLFSLNDLITSEIGRPVK